MTTEIPALPNDRSRGLHLRVLIANEHRERLEKLAEVIAREIDVAEVGPATARERPDIALVRLGSSSEHALDLISEIVSEASCPVVALLSESDAAYVHETAKRGVFAYIVERDAVDLQGAIDVTLQRFAQYQNLNSAFGRRAVIEQAKGILMPATASTRSARSTCCATTPAATTASSWTWRRRSSRATCSCCRRRRPDLAKPLPRR